VDAYDIELQHYSEELVRLSEELSALDAAL
jgi:hypothetical protein